MPRGRKKIRKPKIKSLDQIRLEYTLLTLCYCEGNRAATAESLGISIRSLRNCIIEAEKTPVHKAFIEKVDIDALANQPDKYLCQALPTNEERIKYKDTFPNWYQRKNDETELQK